MDPTASVCNRNRGKELHVPDSPRLPTSHYQNMVGFKHKTHTLPAQVRAHQLQNYYLLPIIFATHRSNFWDIHWNLDYNIFLSVGVLSTFVLGQPVEIYFHHTVAETL